MGFDLRLRNVPAGAVLWDANFAEKSFDYVPIADSGWLPINREWSYPSDPRNVTTLHILVLDADNNVLLEVYNLGPVRDEWYYIYDCSTGQLIECRLEGTIIEKVILHDAESLPIPAEIGLGESGQIQIKGRNDDLVAQQMGAYWRIERNDSIVEDVEIWADELVIPGYIVAIKGSPIVFTHLGTYKLAFQLLMNKDCPEVVDFYIGDLCSVVPIAYRGTISRKELEYDETRANIPVW